MLFNYLPILMLILFYFIVLHEVYPALLIDKERAMEVELKLYTVHNVPPSMNKRTYNFIGRTFTIGESGVLGAANLP